MDATGKLNLNLPTKVEETLTDLFSRLPIGTAMPELCPSSPARGEALSLAEQAIRALDDPSLIAGIWLYVDELDRSHTVSQSIPDATGAYWHAIMHRRQGDFDNSKYWLRRADRHPAMDALGATDPLAFVDEVRERFRDNPVDLVELQRLEWAGLFKWCALRAAGGGDS